MEGIVTMPFIIPRKREINKTLLRDNLVSCIRDISETEQPIRIEFNGTIIAELSTDSPTQSNDPEPLRARTKLVRADWSDFLDAILIEGACYYFHLKDANPVYFYRISYRNKYIDEWREHKLSSKKASGFLGNAILAIDEFRGACDEIENKMAEITTYLKSVDNGNP
jgi:hypothetical protein